MAKKKVERIGVAKALENVSYRNNLSQVFNDFLTMVVCCFSMERMEDKYLETTKRYDKDELSRFSETLGEMIIEYENAAFDGGWDDIIGHLFEEVNSSSQASNMGQFFTPKSICDMMARMTTGDGTTVNDPTCGSGRNLIAHSRLSPENRHNCFYYGSDLDERCVNMTVINMVMYGMKGIVIHMNALSLEIFKGYRVYSPETGLGVVPLSINDCKRIMFQSKRTQTDANERKPAQIIEEVIVIESTKHVNQLALF